MNLASNSLIHIVAFSLMDTITVSIPMAKISRFHRQIRKVVNMLVRKDYRLYKTLSQALATQFHPKLTALNLVNWVNSNTNLIREIHHN